MEPLAPENAVERYIKSRHDALPSTRNKHRYRLKHFLTWTEREGLEDMTNLTGRDCEDYKNYRLNETECNLVTLEQHLHTFRVFLRYCESINAVRGGLSEKVIIPNVSSKDKARDEHLAHETAKEIIDYLVRYEWATLEHLTFHLAYHTGMRRSALYALDVDDWHSDEQWFAVRHRPETETPLKLQEEGERNLSIRSDTLSEAIDDYLRMNRPEVEDEHGREPFFASTHGRLHYNTLQKKVYRVTRPCYYTNECPHGRDMDDCEATDYAKFSQCPSSVSPHPVRRSAITHHLNEDVPKAVCSERMAVSQQTLDLHYDARSKEEKRQNREQYLGNL